MPTRDTVPGLAARLKAARLAAGLSQKKAAEQSGLSQGNLSRYEDDKRAPTLLVLYHLARAYGVTVCDLLPPEADVLPPAGGD